jgi:hypothetical protein
MGPLLCFAAEISASWQHCDSNVHPVTSEPLSGAGRLASQHLTLRYLLVCQLGCIRRAQSVYGATYNILIVDALAKK